VARPRKQPGENADPQPNENQPPQSKSKEPPSKTNPGSPGSRRSTPANETADSSTSSPPKSPTPKAEDPFAIERPPPFKPGDESPNLESDLEELDEPDPQLFDWTPERAGAVIRAGGYVLHTADRMGNVDGGDQLWKATEADAQAAGEPLARILNRYDSARRLAGMVDEAEFAAAMFDYARRNLALRGQLVRRHRVGQEEPLRGATAFDSMAGERYDVPPVPPPAEEEPLFAAEERHEEDPTQPAAFVFDPWESR
jgi:hypothetical protein